MSDEARAHLRIYGRVQGVTFRASTRRESRERGVTGWVQNLRDGSVEAVIEGPRDDVEEVVDWAHDGPPRANVENIDVEWKEPTGEFSDFRVRR